MACIAADAAPLQRSFSSRNLPAVFAPRMGLLRRFASSLFHPSTCWRFHGFGSSFASVAASMQLNPRPILAPFLVAMPLGRGFTRIHLSRRQSTGGLPHSSALRNQLLGGFPTAPVGPSFRARPISSACTRWAGLAPPPYLAGIIGVLACSMRGGPSFAMGSGSPAVRRQWGARQLAPRAMRPVRSEAVSQNG